MCTLVCGETSWSSTTGTVFGPPLPLVGCMSTRRSPCAGWALALESRTAPLGPLLQQRLCSCLMLPVLPPSMLHDPAGGCPALALRRGGSVPCPSPLRIGTVGPGKSSRQLGLVISPSLYPAPTTALLRGVFGGSRRIIDDGLLLCKWTTSCANHSSPDLRLALP
jgi:hypothetical protein